MDLNPLFVIQQASNTVQSKMLLLEAFLPTENLLLQNDSKKRSSNDGKKCVAATYAHIFVLLSQGYCHGLVRGYLHCSYSCRPV